MRDVPFHLLSDFERTFFESEAPAPEWRFDARSIAVRVARQRFESLIRTLEWHEGEQSREGHGPVGRCLVTWIDAYPLVAFTEPDANGYHHGIISGHCSCGGGSADGLMLNMLAMVARHPDGRLGSDSRWLRKGGKAGFFAFHGIDDPKTSNTRTMADLLDDPNLRLAAEGRRLVP